MATTPSRTNGGARRLGINWTTENSSTANLFKVVLSDEGIPPSRLGPKRSRLQCLKMAACLTICRKSCRCLQLSTTQLERAWEAFNVSWNQSAKEKGWLDVVAERTSRWDDNVAFIQERPPGY